MELFKRILTFIADAIQTVLVTASVFMILYAFVIQPNEVSGSSMYPTFKDKEFLLSYLLDIRMQNYARGDVVVFRSPIEPDKLYIKRIIGFPGDTVRIEGGKVYLNGMLLDESAYLSPEVMTYPGAFLQEGVEMIVPEETVLVLGDNRSYSSDSREWGFLPKDRLIGKSVVRVYPFETFTFIKNPYK